MGHIGRENDLSDLIIQEAVEEEFSLEKEQGATNVHQTIKSISPSLKAEKESWRAVVLGEDTV